MSVHHSYRWLTGAAVLLALLLTLLPAQDKRRLGMPEPWSYELAAEQLAQGNWHLDDAQMTAARTQVRLAGAQLTQYVPVAPDRWALRQSPGHTLEMAALVLLGAPRLTNTVLALLAVLALYPALAAWHGERAAFLGVTLFLLSPMSLLALHYSSMDTFFRRCLAAHRRRLAAGVRRCRTRQAAPDVAAAGGRLCHGVGHCRAPDQRAAIGASGRPLSVPGVDREPAAGSRQPRAPVPAMAPTVPTSSPICWLCIWSTPSPPFPSHRKTCGRWLWTSCGCR